MLTPSEVAVVTKFQAERIDRIKEFHRSCLKSFADQMGYAFLVGMELLALKEETPHGQFEKLKKEHFEEIPRTSLGRYMQFAEAIQSKYPTVGYLRPAKLLTDGQFDQKEQEKVLKAVHDVADGKTLTQLYRDLGVIRDRKPNEHHPRKPLNPDEELAARKKSADDLAIALLGQGNLLMQGDAWSLLSSGRQAELEDWRLLFGQFIKEHSPKKKPVGQKKN